MLQFTSQDFSDQGNFGLSKVPERSLRIDGRMNAGDYQRDHRFARHVLTFTTQQILAGSRQEIPVHRVGERILPELTRFCESTIERSDLAPSTRTHLILYLLSKVDPSLGALSPDKVEQFTRQKDQLEGHVTRLHNDLIHLQPQSQMLIQLCKQLLPMSRPFRQRTSSARLAQEQRFLSIESQIHQQYSGRPGIFSPVEPVHHASPVRRVNTARRSSDLSLDSYAHIEVEDANAHQFLQGLVEVGQIDNHYLAKCQTMLPYLLLHVMEGYDFPTKDPELAQSNATRKRRFLSTLRQLSAHKINDGKVATFRQNINDLSTKRDENLRNTQYQELLRKEKSDGLNSAERKVLEAFRSTIEIKNAHIAELERSLQIAQNPYFYQMKTRLYQQIRELPNRDPKIEQLNMKIVLITLISQGISSFLEGTGDPDQSHLHASGLADVSSTIHNSYTKSTLLEAICAGFRLGNDGAREVFTRHFEQLKLGKLPKQRKGKLNPGKLTPHFDNFRAQYTEMLQLLDGMVEKKDFCFGHRLGPTLLNPPSFHLSDHFQDHLTSIRKVLEHVYKDAVTTSKREFEKTHKASVKRSNDAKRLGLRTVTDASFTQTVEQSPRAMVAHQVHYQQALLNYFQELGRSLVEDLTRHQLVQLTPRESQGLDDRGRQDALEAKVQNIVFGRSDGIITQILRELNPMGDDEQPRYRHDLEVRPFGHYLRRRTALHTKTDQHDGRMAKIGAWWAKGGVSQSKGNGYAFEAAQDQLLKDHFSDIPFLNDRFERRRLGKPIQARNLVKLAGPLIKWFHQDIRTQLMIDHDIDLDADRFHYLAMDEKAIAAHISERVANINSGLEGQRLTGNAPEEDHHDLGTQLLLDVPDHHQKGSSVYRDFVLKGRVLSPQSRHYGFEGVDDFSRAGDNTLSLIGDGDGAMVSSMDRSGPRLPSFCVQTVQPIHLLDEGNETSRVQQLNGRDVHYIETAESQAHVYRSATISAFRWGDRIINGKHVHYKRQVNELRPHSGSYISSLSDHQIEEHRRLLFDQIRPKIEGMIGREALQEFEESMDVLGPNNREVTVPRRHHRGLKHTVNQFNFRLDDVLVRSDDGLVNPYVRFQDFNSAGKAIYKTQLSYYTMLLFSLSRALDLITGIATDRGCPPSTFDGVEQLNILRTGLLHESDLEGQMLRTEHKIFEFLSGGCESDMEIRFVQQSPDNGHIVRRIKPNVVSLHAPYKGKFFGTSVPEYSQGQNKMAYRRIYSGAQDYIKLKEAEQFSVNRFEHQASQLLRFPDKGDRVSHINFLVALDDQVGSEDFDELLDSPILQYTDDQGRDVNLRNQLTPIVTQIRRLRERRTASDDELAQLNQQARHVLSDIRKRFHQHALKVQSILGQIHSTLLRLGIVDGKITGSAFSSSTQNIAQLWMHLAELIEWSISIFCKSGMDRTEMGAAQHLSTYMVNDTPHDIVDVKRRRGYAAANTAILHSSVHANIHKRSRVQNACRAELMDLKECVRFYPLDFEMPSDTRLRNPRRRHFAVTVSPAQASSLVPS